jgi:hypothetical protein
VVSTGETAFLFLFFLMKNMFVSSNNSSLVSDSFILSTDLTDSNPSSVTGKRSKFTPAQTASYRRGITLDIATRLESSALSDSCLSDLSARTLAISDCLRETALPENVYFSVDQTNFRTGECFDGYGSLAVSAGTRLCPNYQAKQSSRTNKRIRSAFERVGITDSHGNLLAKDGGNLLNFERGVRLRFLTLSMPRLDCSSTTKLLILAYALVLFKKRSLWVENVKGAYISKEFTGGKAVDFHWNFHSHALVASKWLDHGSIAFHWTECVIAACSEYDIEFPEVDSKGNRINFLNVWVKDVSTYAEENQMSLDSAVFEISKYMAKGSDILNVPSDELPELNDVLSGRRMIESYGIFNSHKGKSVNKVKIVESKPLVHKRTQMTAKENKPTLVRIGTKMILDGKRDEWLLFLRRKMEKRRAFRRHQLSDLNPMAKFFTLDGGTFSSSDFIFPEKPNVKSFVSFTC